MLFLVMLLSPLLSWLSIVLNDKLPSRHSKFNTAGSGMFVISHIGRFLSTTCLRAGLTCELTSDERGELKATDRAQDHTLHLYALTFIR